MPKTVSPVDKHIGARIRMRRNQLGLSQSDLAEGMGITFQQIQKYENGTNRVGGSRMAQIAARLEVDVGFFYLDLPGADGAGNHGPIGSVMDEFMATKDGLVIAEAFVQIVDPQVRHIIAQAIGDISRALAPPRRLLAAAE
jgi:transcriptional regulator with XRE-family HTH domain